MKPPRVSLVTGGSRGLGRAIALALADKGDAVMIGYRTDATKADEVVRKIQSNGANATALPLDVTSEDQIQAAIRETVSQFGALDILVNNAGLLDNALLSMMSDATWRRVLDVNLDGVFRCCRAASRQMIAQRGGRIINIASLSAIRPLAGQANYAAAKAGVVAMTKALARELGRFGITVNAVAPGYIESEMQTGMTTKLTDAERATALADVPLGRFARAEEVAAVVRFLASPAAAYMTGTVMTVDGGIS